MSRKIKFRIWNNASKKMEYDPSIRIKSDDIINGELIIWLNNWLNDPTPDCEKQDEYLGKIVEQYTGLTDKNGKEIYEGDLIRLSSTGAPALKGRNLIVKFDELDIGEYNCRKMVGWMVEVVDNDWEWASSLSDVVSLCEVIGNIHEPIDKSNQVC